MLHKTFRTFIAAGVASVGMTAAASAAAPRDGSDERESRAIDRRPGRRPVGARGAHGDR